VIVLLVVAAVVVGAPLGAAVLVTVASHREDAARTLAGRPPGPFAAASRRLLRLSIGGTAYRRRTARPRRRARRAPPMPGPEAELPPGRTRTLTLPRL
jgi:hypothetical protein